MIAICDLASLADSCDERRQASMTDPPNPIKVAGCNHQSALSVQSFEGLQISRGHAILMPEPMSNKVAILYPPPDCPSAHLVSLGDIFEGTEGLWQRHLVTDRIGHKVSPRAFLYSLGKMLCLFRTISSVFWLSPGIAYRQLLGPLGGRAPGLSTAACRSWS